MEKKVDLEESIELHGRTKLNIRNDSLRSQERGVERVDWKDQVMMYKGLWLFFAIFVFLVVAATPPATPTPAPSAIAATPGSHTSAPVWSSPPTSVESLPYVTTILLFLLFLILIGAIRRVFS